MDAKPSVLLADTSVLYSGLVYRGKDHHILLSGRYLFFTTEFSLREMYWILRRKRELPHTETIAALRTLPVVVVGEMFFTEHMTDAVTLIGKRDASDAPLVALAIAMEPQHDGIWTKDKDFDVVTSRFRIWKTTELL